MTADDAALAAGGVAPERNRTPGARNSLRTGGSAVRSGCPKQLVEKQLWDLVATGRGGMMFESSESPSRAAGSFPPTARRRNPMYHPLLFVHPSCEIMLPANPGAGFPSGGLAVAGARMCERN